MIRTKRAMRERCAWRLRKVPSRIAEEELLFFLSPQEFRILKFRSAIRRAIIKRFRGRATARFHWVDMRICGRSSRERKRCLFRHDSFFFRMLSCRQPLLRTSKASGSSQTTWVPASRMPPSTISISIDARPTHRVGRRTLHVQASRRHDDGRVQ